MPLSTIFQLYSDVSFIGGGNRSPRRNLPPVTDKLYHIMLYTSLWAGFEPTTSEEIINKNHELIGKVWGYKGVIGIRKPKMNRQCNGQRNKQKSSKHYAQKTNHWATRTHYNRGWTHVLRNGYYFLLYQWHSLCYSSWNYKRESKRKRWLNLVIAFILIPKTSN